MALHYPLNGLNLDFSRYEHRPLGARDIMVNRIMEDYMAPKRVKGVVYQRPFKVFDFTQIKGRDRSLGLDMQILSKILHTHYNWSFTPRELSRLFEPPLTIFLDFTTVFLMVDTQVTLGAVILGLIERHYLESNPSMRIWLKHYYSYCSSPIHGPGWKKDVVEHLKSLRPAGEEQYRQSLYSGGHYLPINIPSNVQFSIDPCFVGAPRFNILKLEFSTTFRKNKMARKPGSRKIPLGDLASLHRGRPQRSSSVPICATWGIAAIQNLNSHRDEKWGIFFPRRPLSELDKLSRRRSLSRTHIREMFTDKPEWFQEEPMEGIKHPCGNCAQYTHRTKNCPSQCGFCGSIFHKANACPVKSSNRCKCRPFPQCHTALECYVRCSRPCGCPHHLGHFKHKNAMLCSYRCCMCGIKGHSGRKCSLKKCPCGGQHLTQDCRWKVECSAKDCNFYLCRLHCRECGRKKERGSSDHFVGRTCQDCLRNGQPVLNKTEIGV
ncbi:hypothetical protein F4804DRAFT_326713 [Jackrogersella minutella]|nr:hypothetical protein F4804DRAFT_326713 [Jackrogersella minutella]